MKIHSIRSLGWLVLLAIIMVACKKPILEPEPEITEVELPPKTKEGKHTFGCLVDGRVFVAHVDNPNPLGAVALSVTYNESNGYFVVGGTHKLSNGDYETVTIRTYITEELGTYEMHFVSDEFIGHQIIGETLACDYYHDLDNRGTVTITNIDTLKKNVSGTFEMELINLDCSEKTTMSITDGRFDVRY